MYAIRSYYAFNAIMGAGVLMILASASVFFVEDKLDLKKERA